MKPRIALWLKSSLPLTYLLLIGLVAATVLGVYHLAAQRAVAELSHALMLKVGERAQEKSAALLANAAQVVRLNAELLNNGEPAAELFATVVHQQLRQNPTLASIYFGEADGDHFASRRMGAERFKTTHITRRDDSPASRVAVEQAQRLLEQKQREPAARLIAPYLETTWYERSATGTPGPPARDPYLVYDPRLRPWYLGAEKAEEGSTEVSWTAVYTWPDPSSSNHGYQVGISAALPVFREGRLAGVMAADLVLDELSRFLGELRVGEHGQSFVIDDHGTAIGLREFDRLLAPPERPGAAPRLKPIAATGEAALGAAYAALQRELGHPADSPAGVGLRGTRLLRFTLEQVGYFAFFQPLEPRHGLEWIIGVVVPEDDFLGEVKQGLRLALLVSGGVILLVGVLALYISHRITRPLELLSHEARKVAVWDLSPAAVAVESPFQEIAQMADSFADMQAGLRSFAKYVPADLVRRVLESGREANLGGERRAVTLFFSDIANFTTISEQLTPERLVELLGEYLAAMTGIIQGEHGGAVDKFIGDAIMAFWNAPATQPDHPVLACRAALECQHRLRELRPEWVARGFPEISCRIGLNSGEVLVGNLGSATRLNYTAIGDAVNLASRLEGACKQYGVEILISSFTRSQAGERFATRLLDYLVVKGKSQGVFVYELLGETGALAEPERRFLEHYQRGISHWTAGEWNPAREELNHALKLRPDEMNCQRFIEWCSRAELDETFREGIAWEAWRNELQQNHMTTTERAV